MPSAAGRFVAAVDFWIQLSARRSRWRRAWVLLHQLLSTPLLVRVERRFFELVVDGTVLRVRARARSDAFLAIVGGHERDRSGAGAGAGERPDVEVVQIHPWSGWWRRRRGWLVVPGFVRYRAPVAAVPPARRSKSLRGSMARARRSGFRPRPGTAADWPRARAMAESWAILRFGERTWLPPEHAWRRLRRHGRLIMIGDATRDIATAVVVPSSDGREAWFASLGVADRDTALLRGGALTAAYAAAVEDARRIGAEIFDSGRCSARLDDPIAVYKVRWGLRPEPDPLVPVYALRPGTGAGERWLAALPVYGRA